MALWAKIQQLPENNKYLRQIKGMYGEHFPIEVRHHFAEYIEQTFRSGPLPVRNNPEYEHQVAELIEQLIKEVENPNSCNDLSPPSETQSKLDEAAKKIRQRYGTCPMQLFNFIRQCLLTEVKLLQNATTVELKSEATDKKASSPEKNNKGDISSNLRQLRRAVKVTANTVIPLIKRNQDMYATQLYECQEVSDQLAQMPIKSPPDEIVRRLSLKTMRMKGEVNRKAAWLVEFQMKVNEDFEKSLDLIKELKSQIMDGELIKWKRRQQLKGNGCPFLNNLDQIEEWCKSLVELVWIRRKQMIEVQQIRQDMARTAPRFDDQLPILSENICHTLTSIITSAFIVETQPPQILRPLTSFQAEVRFLIGDKLDIHKCISKVKVSILTELQTRLLFEHDKLPHENDLIGDLTDNIGIMKLHTPRNKLSVYFGDLMLEELDKQETSRFIPGYVDTNEKFSLLFQTQFNVGEGDLEFEAWTFSLPIYILRRDSQEARAWATITWDNAFSGIFRRPFVVPQKVPWLELKQTLSDMFKFNTGRALSDDDMRIFAEKLFANDFIVNDNPWVTWAHCCEENMSGYQFTFWEWFFATMQLVNRELQEPWVDGLIMGFVEKSKAEEMLANCPSGTFLLRFSENHLGSINITFISDEREVLHLVPYTISDLKGKSLAERILELPDLVTVYPNIAKNIFTEYMEASTNTPRFDDYVDNVGYVKPILVIRGLNPAPQVIRNEKRDSPAVGSTSTYYVGEKEMLKLITKILKILQEEIRILEEPKTYKPVLTNYMQLHTQHSIDEDRRIQVKDTSIKQSSSDDNSANKRVEDKYSPVKRPKSDGNPPNQPPSLTITPSNNMRFAKRCRTLFAGAISWLILAKLTHMVASVESANTMENYNSS